ncbi:MAG: hypothetical protein ACMG6S_17650, partial [Byssovorax sp.]
MIVAVRNRVVGEGRLDAARDGGAVDPFERRLPRRGEGDRGDALAKDAAAVGPLVAVEVENAFEGKVSARGHERGAAPAHEALVSPRLQKGRAKGREC